MAEYWANYFNYLLSYFVSPRLPGRTADDKMLDLPTPPKAIWPTVHA